LERVDRCDANGADVRARLASVTRYLRLLIRQRQSDPDGELLHGITEADAVPELYEPDDVTTDTATEAVEKTFALMDMERCRVLNVERTPARMRGASLCQEQVILNHRGDIGSTLELPDEFRRIR
jgi:hypothetical protein